MYNYIKKDNPFSKNVICDTCGEQFVYGQGYKFKRAVKVEGKWATHRFCCEKCMNDSFINRGRFMTDEELDERQRENQRRYIQRKKARSCNV